MRSLILNLLHVLLGFWAVVGTIVGLRFAPIGFAGGAEDLTYFADSIGYVFVPVLLLGLTIWLIRGREIDANSLDGFNA